MKRLLGLLPAPRWSSADCGCTWRYSRLRFHYLACQDHAYDAPRIRLALASGTAHLIGGGR